FPIKKVSSMNTNIIPIHNNQLIFFILNILHYRLKSTLIISNQKGITNELHLWTFIHCMLVLIYYKLGISTHNLTLRDYPYLLHQRYNNENYTLFALYLVYL